MTTTKEQPAKMIASLLFLAACGGHPPAPAPTPAPEQETAPMPAPHPGTVTFVDLDTNTSHEEPIASLPETIAWVVVAGERVPVTRVESRSRPGGSREIIKYGADGAQLEVTISAPRPPPR